MIEISGSNLVKIAGGFTSTQHGTSPDNVKIIDFKDEDWAETIIRKVTPSNPERPKKPRPGFVDIIV